MCVLMRTKAFFQNIRQQLLSEIDSASIQIIVAVAWFTDKKLFHQLLKKAKEGVEVQIMIADDPINLEYGPDYDELLRLGGSVIKVNAPDPETIMHNKFCIIDGKTVITGSYNWSKKAGTNHENITITWEEPILARQFLQEFERLKERYHQQPTAGKLPFDYAKVSQRLQVIQSLINLSEFQELELQLEKLQQYELVAEVEQIIEFIRKFYYSDALVAIEALKIKYSSIVSRDADKIASLKLRLIYLEIELSSLQGQHDSLEKAISDFRYRVRTILGDLILQLLDLKIEWNKIREKLGKAFKYEDLREEYQSFEEEVKEARAQTKPGISEDDEKLLKELYKKGVQLCHPDKVQEPYKAKAKEIFIRLKKAFDENNLSEVRHIVSSLENGIWELGPELREVKEVEKLEALVQELTLKVETIRKRIDELSASEDYQQLQRSGSIEAYLKAEEVALKKDIIIYQEKILKYKHEQSTAAN